MIIGKILDEYKIPKLLERLFDHKSAGLYLDLMAYLMICENNAGQHYLMYAYCHILFTEGMNVRVSDFLCGMTIE